MKLNVLTLVFLTLLLGCKKGPEAEWIYGRWFETLDGGEIEFRKGGKVTWFGKKGTFSFEKNSTLSLICIPRCKDGELKVKVGKDTYRFDYDLNKGVPRPKSWTISFENISEMETAETIQGKETRALYMSSTREGGGPYKPKGVERFDKGLYKYNSMSTGGIVNGQLVGGIWWGKSGLFRYDKSSSQWKDISPQGKLDSIGSLFYGRKVILNNFFTGHKYSLDTGNSWKKIPQIKDYIGGNIGVNPTFLDHIAFQLESEPVPDGGDWSRPRPYGLYSVDLSKSSPTWKKVYDFPEDLDTNHYFLNLYTSEKVGDIYVFANPIKSKNQLNNEKVRMFRSQDKGVSFEEIALPELDNLGQAKGSDKGIVITGWKRIGQNPKFILGVFNSETVSWNIIPLEREIFSWYPYGETALVYNWGKGLDRLNEDGTLTPRYYFEGIEGNNFQTPIITVLGKDIYLSSFTIWKVSN